MSYKSLEVIYTSKEIKKSTIAPLSDELVQIRPYKYHYVGAGDFIPGLSLKY